jgi:hypothetical protein
VAARVTKLRWFPALGLMALSLPSWTPATLAAGGPGAARCRPPRSRTLVVGPTARVYSMPTPPGTNPEPRPPVFAEPAAVALGEGPWVAYAESFFSIDTSVQTISSRNLRTGATVRCAIGFTQAPARAASVTTILIGRDGTIVWIGRSGAHPTEPLAPEVGTCDPRENGEGKILDRGPEIDLGSLVARGRSAAWIDGEETRSVPLR